MKEPPARIGPGASLVSGVLAVDVADEVADQAVLGPADAMDVPTLILRDGVGGGLVVLVHVLILAPRASERHPLHRRS